MPCKDDFACKLSSTNNETVSPITALAKEQLHYGPVTSLPWRDACACDGPNSSQAFLVCCFLPRVKSPVSPSALTQVNRATCLSMDVPWSKPRDLKSSLPVFAAGLSEPKQLGIEKIEI